MRADFYLSEDPETVVGTARWTGRRAEVSAEDEQVRATLTRLFRATPVAVDDPSLRPHGAVGEVVVQPGSLEWFRLVGPARAPGAGFQVRLVPEVPLKTGWDPAADYSTFRKVVTHMESPVSPGTEASPEVAKPV